MSATLERGAGKIDRTQSLRSGFGSTARAVRCTRFPAPLALSGVIPEHWRRPDHDRPFIDLQAPPDDFGLAPDYVLTDKTVVWKWLVGALVVVLTIVLLIVAALHDAWNHTRENGSRPVSAVTL